jgi:hypothetical protein
VASDSLSIRPEVLLRHRDFVRAIAKGLLEGDPSGGAPVRAKAAAGAGREADRADAELRERLGLEHQVVTAVLGLREPFRTVMLLRYYAHLSPARIADRRGVSTQVVHDQLARAHDLLRERLDAAFEGGRAVWTPGLAALTQGKAVLSSMKRIAILVGALALAVAIPAFLWRSDGSGGDSDFSPGYAPAASADHPGALPQVASEPGGEDAATDATPRPGKSREELEASSTPELVQIAVQVQHTLRARILSPTEPVHAHRALFALPPSGLARLIHRGKLGTDDVNPIGLRGGGCAISFSTRGQALDDDPDVVLQQGFLTSAGSGPGILDLGERKLESLGTSILPAPEGLNESELRAWAIFWRDAGVGPTGSSRRKHARSSSGPRRRRRGARTSCAGCGPAATISSPRSRRSPRTISAGRSRGAC